MAYNKFKDLEKRTQPDIVLQNKAHKIASNTMVMKEDYQVWFINFLTKNQKNPV